jgi:hypothetical protein
VQAYDFENLSLDLKLVRTNFPPRTIVRGPGFINSVMIIEQASTSSRTIPNQT